MRAHGRAVNITDDMNKGGLRKQKEAGAPLADSARCGEPDGSTRRQMRTPAPTLAPASVTP